MSIEVNRKIVVKSIVTPELKEEINGQINNAENGLKNNLSILNEKLTDKKNAQFVGQIQNEIVRLNQQLQELSRKRNEIETLDFGQEFYQGTIDSPVSVDLGDNLFEKISKAEILVNNGEVVEFRNI